MAPQGKRYLQFYEWADGLDGCIDSDCQALAILAGVCNKDVADKLRKEIANEQNGFVKTTLSYSLYKYEALLTEPTAHGQFVFDQIKRDWGYMLASGATSFWETIKGSADFDGFGSLCHGWSGIPAYFSPISWESSL